uniref:Peptidyl-prolyl cis-trans isomerase n=1 Tax=Salix viminalis TaxID=40686 RepID=A0A6N2LTS9_SALVM
MGKDSKSKDAGAKGKGKGKQAGGGSEENVSKGKGKSGKASDGLGTCTYVKARHILCEKQGKINEAYQKLQDGWLSNGDKVPPAEFAKVASEYSECPSGKKGGDLGWFPRGKMAGPFQDVAFATPIGATSAPFKSTTVGRGHERRYAGEELCRVNSRRDSKGYYRIPIVVSNNYNANACIEGDL